MKRENNETIEQYLNRRNEEYDQALAEKKNKKKDKKRKRKGLIFGISLGVLGVITAVTGIFHSRKYKKYEEPKNKVETVVDNDSLTDLGFEEEKTTENEKDTLYGNPTGTVKKEDVVEKDGTIWHDKEAADNSHKVGKEELDDKNGTLVQKPNGDVYEKEQDYVVKDENGNTTQSGTNESGTPEGLVWDEELKAYVKPEEKGLYTYADATYYDENGEVVVEKGMKIKKETLKKVKKYYSTEKPKKETSNNKQENTTNNKPEETTNNKQENTTNNKTETTVDEGVLNADGTYTISGVTFINKETYDAFASGNYDEESVRSDENGVIYFSQKTR